MKLSHIPAVILAAFFVSGAWGQDTPSPTPAPEATPTPAESGLDVGPLINTNGGFEQGLSAYWFSRADACTIDTNEVYRGTSSLKITGPGTTTGDGPTGGDPLVVAASQISPAQSGDVYVFRCVVKTKNVDPSAPPRIDLVTSKDPTQAPQDYLPESKKLVFSEDKDWTPYEVLIKSLAPGTAKLGFWIRVPQQTTATLWVDEIEIRKVNSK